MLISPHAVKAEAEKRLEHRGGQLAHRRLVPAKGLVAPGCVEHMFHARFLQPLAFRARCLCDGYTSSRRARNVNGALPYYVDGAAKSFAQQETPRWSAGFSRLDQNVFERT